ncbi:DUF3108 domain-containing protein [Trinickia terrae]|uniref:DUF3108 domain-containing protein n=1 Tax=Trinickia terrae TaxID=2571161 RepID=A0A4U1HKK1_9BURK|nr:DUF3108 domain-containing protein [Trinickia terrae]TKC79884.1 DUF3108 domain-containing protein [Trinickia terrae]
MSRYFSTLLFLGLGLFLTQASCADESIESKPFQVEYRGPIVGTRYRETCITLSPADETPCDSGWSTIISADGMVVHGRSDSEDYTEVGIFIFETDISSEVKNKIATLWPLSNFKTVAFTEKQNWKGNIIHNSYKFDVIGRETISTPAGKFNTIKVRSNIFYAASNFSEEAMNWWDPATGLIVKMDEIVNGPFPGHYIRIVDRITRRPAEDKEGTHQKDSLNICSMQLSGKTFCLNKETFQSLAVSKKGNESAGEDAIDAFRRDAISYGYNGGNFDELIIKALSRVGYDANPAHAAGAYIESGWKLSEGRSMLLKKWIERTKISALITKDLFKPDVFWVLVGCSIEESPDNSDWTQIERTDDIRNKIEPVLQSINSIIKASGGKLLGGR